MSTKKVLVAEDDIDIAKALKAHLKAMGHETTHVADGETATEILRKNRFDLICLDLSLPVVSGFEVCRRLRNDPKHQDVPVLVLTGRDSLEDQASALESGATEFMTKPFRAKAFAAMVNRLLETI